MFSLAAAGVTVDRVVHVSANASVTVEGTAGLPFNTIDEATAHVRKLRQEEPAIGTIVVAIGAGRHRAFSVASGESVDARTIYRGVGDSTVVSGGVEVPPSLWHANKVGAPAVYTADLTSLNISDADLGAIAAGGCVHGCPDMQSPLSFNGTAMNLARWPNLEISTGHNVYANAAAPCGAGCLNLGKGSDAAARASRWANQSDAWVHGCAAYCRRAHGPPISEISALYDDRYFEWDWADCYRQVTSIGGGGAELRFTSPAAAESPKANARFYVTNVSLRACALSSLAPSPCVAGTKLLPGRCSVSWTRPVSSISTRRHARCT